MRNLQVWVIFIGIVDFYRYYWLLKVWVTFIGMADIYRYGWPLQIWATFTDMGDFYSICDLYRYGWLLLVWCDFYHYGWHYFCDGWHYTLRELLISNFNGTSTIKCSSTIPAYRFPFSVCRAASLCNMWLLPTFSTSRLDVHFTISLISTWSYSKNLNNRLPKFSISFQSSLPARHSIENLVEIHLETFATNAARDMNCFAEATKPIICLVC